MQGKNTTESFKQGDCLHSKFRRFASHQKGKTLLADRPEGARRTYSLWIKGLVERVGVFFSSDKRS